MKKKSIFVRNLEIKYITTTNLPKYIVGWYPVSTNYFFPELS